MTTPMYLKERSLLLPLMIVRNWKLEYTGAAFYCSDFFHKEKWDCYKNTAAVIACFKVEFKQKGLDDQAEYDCMSFPDKIAKL